MRRAAVAMASVLRVVCCIVSCRVAVRRIRVRCIIVQYIVAILSAACFMCCMVVLLYWCVVALFRCCVVASLVCLICRILVFLHSLHCRVQQAATCGFTEFVPLSFVAQEAPAFRDRAPPPAGAQRRLIPERPPGVLCVARCVASAAAALRTRSAHMRGTQSTQAGCSEYSRGVL